MDLATFLAQSTTSNDDATALSEAQTHTENQGSYISSDRLTMMLVGAGLYSVFHDKAATSGDPARDVCLGLMARLGTNSDFNFIQGDTNGDANLAMIDDLINTTMTAQATALKTLKSQIIAEANTQIKPFANATLTDVLSIRHPGSEVEVTYPASASYLSVGSGQGADILATLASAAAADLRIDVYLSVGFNVGQANEAFVKRPQAIGFINIAAGNTQGYAAFNASLIRGQNKFFLRPQFSVSLTGQAMVNSRA